MTVYIVLLDDTYILWIIPVKVLAWMINFLKFFVLTSYFFSPFFSNSISFCIFYICSFIFWFSVCCFSIYFSYFSSIYLFKFYFTISILSASLISPKTYKFKIDVSFFYTMLPARWWNIVLTTITFPFSSIFNWLDGEFMISPNLYV